MSVRELELTGAAAGSTISTQLILTPLGAMITGEYEKGYWGGQSCAVVYQDGTRMDHTEIEAGRMSPEGVCILGNWTFGEAVDLDRAAALPETLTLADREEIEDLAMIYNTLSAEQKEFVQGGYDGTDYQKLLAVAQDKLAALDAGETDPEPSPDPEGDKDKGCKSHAEAGGLAVAVIAVLAGAALFVSKRKTEEK